MAELKMQTKTPNMTKYVKLNMYFCCIAFNVILVRAAIICWLATTNSIYTEFMTSPCHIPVLCFLIEKMLQ